MLLTLVLVPSTASAGGYNYLKFTSDSGEIYAIAAENLEILIEDGSLTFNNTDLIIPLTSLVSMEFGDIDDDPAAIDSPIMDQMGVVTVFNIEGTRYGSFGSYSEALDSLEPGLYVIKDSNGNSLKIRVGK